MTRDFTVFFDHTDTAPLTDVVDPLVRLGWSNVFGQHTDLETLQRTPPVRVSQVHRSGLHVVGDGIDEKIPPRADVTVGDWLLLDRQLPETSVLLPRKSLFQRRAPGKDRRSQLIAANVDTAFIVTSCNEDFNIARLERFLALAFEAQVTPVVLITKSDLALDPSAFSKQAQKISDRVTVLAVNALGDDMPTLLGNWCKPGQTIAFLGSSGVGKSTLANSVLGQDVAMTQEIRNDDAKGRHTTSHRQLHFTPDGCGVLDTPGMRELQLADVSDGLSDIFADLIDLSNQCRFNDCQHGSEPGCAIVQALQSGAVDVDRLNRWKKLAAEDKLNTENLAQRRRRDKSLGKMIKKIQKNNRK